MQRCSKLILKWPVGPQAKGVDMNPQKILLNRLPAATAGAVLWLLSLATLGGILLRGPTARAQVTDACLPTDSRNST